jgi:hypothetical protein
LQRLVEIVRSEQALFWMQPSGFAGLQATFYNHHILIAGRKGLDSNFKTGRR